MLNIGQLWFVCLQHLARRQLILKQFETILELFFSTTHYTGYKLYNIDWNIIHKSTRVTCNVGTHKLIRLPGYPNHNLNLT